MSNIINISDLASGRVSNPYYLEDSVDETNSISSEFSTGSSSGGKDRMTRLEERIARLEKDITEQFERQKELSDEITSVKANTQNEINRLDRTRGSENDKFDRTRGSENQRSDRESNLEDDSSYGKERMIIFALTVIAGAYLIRR